MQLQAFGASDVGLNRQHNEDAYFMDENLGLFVVADGMGGAQAGEIASRIMVYEVHRHLGTLRRMISRYKQSPDSNNRNEIIRYLPTIIEKANERIFAESARDPDKRGMGTTGVLFLPAGEDAFVSHVGDSRLYLFRQGTLFQITEDHSYVMQLYKQGRISAEEMLTHPQKNLILRGVGIEPQVDVDTLFLDIYPGDVFLMCSDGLSDMVPDEDLADLMASYRGRDLVDQAINAANRNGGLDNITVITVEIQQDTTQLTTQLTTSFSRTLGMVEKVDFLQDIFLFKHLTDQECIKLNRFLFESHYPSGAIIIEEGEPGDELFIVAQGQVAIYQGDTHLLNIGPGGHFGELAILRDDLRSATAVPIRPAPTIPNVFPLIS